MNLLILPDQQYIQSNLVESTFSDLAISYSFYINHEGQTIFEKAYDAIGQGFIPIRNEIGRLFQLIKRSG